MSKQKRNAKKSVPTKSVSGGGAPTANNTAVDPPSPVQLAIAGLTMGAVFVWAYWPTLAETIRTWIAEPDYSHGFLVLPIALYFVWARRDTFPRDAILPSWIGLVLIAAALAGRYVAGLFFMQPVDAWTIPIWVAGTVSLLLGIKTLRWCLPSIVFLWFMMPLPYGAERWLSVPLQRVATQVGTVGLRLVNLPAIAEGNTIWIGEHVLEVERACSGLRIIVGVVALAFAFILFSKWAWWQKAIALVMSIPIAILANAVRIIGTGILITNVSGEAAQRFSHDFAGLVMIPLAAGLFWLLLVYLDRLFPLVDEARLTPMGPAPSRPTPD